MSKLSEQGAAIQPADHALATETMTDLYTDAEGQLPLAVTLLSIDADTSRPLEKLLTSSTSAQISISPFQTITEDLDWTDMEETDVVLLDLSPPVTCPEKLIQTILGHIQNAPIVLINCSMSSILDTLSIASGSFYILERQTINQLNLINALQFATRRWKAEASLRTSQKRYRALYDEMPVMYFTLDTDGQILSVNAFGANHLGYQQDELQGKSVLHVFHEDDKKSVVQHLKELIKSGKESASWQFRKVCKNGKVIWVDETVRCIESDSGEKVILVACEDITERKQSEQAKHESDVWLHSITDNVKAAIYLKDLEGRYLFVNPIFCHMFGIPREDIIGKTDLELIDRETAEIFQANDRHVLECGKHMEYEEHVAHKDGNHIHLSLKFPLCYEDGTPFALGGVSTDITDRIAVKRERSLLASRLIDVQEEERKVISATLHDELGQILTLSRMELASMDIKDQEHSSDVGRVVKRLDDALHFVRRMAVSLRPPLLDDMGLVAAMETLVEEFAESAKIESHFHARDDLLNMPEKAQTCLFRVLQEALTNIAKHAQARRVDIHISYDKPYYTLRVSDDGKGFEGTIPYGITSLGIIGIRERLSKLGGQLNIRSTLKQGTTLEATLPGHNEAKEESP